MRYFITIWLLCIALNASPQKANLPNTFLVKPYLQVGTNPSGTTLQLLWHSSDTAAEWLAERSGENANSWIRSQPPAANKITAAGVVPHTVYSATFTGLAPGTVFNYRVSKNGKVVFTAQAKAPKSLSQPYRLVVFGDIGAGTKEAIEIAHGVYNAKPDLIAVPGDIVYDYGLIADYKTKFWPVYNADAGDSSGVSLLRSVPFIASVGNHDADTRDLDKYPDALAYYLYWQQPLNGPVGKEGGAFVPVLKGSDQNKKAFTQAAGNRYPVMSNFSYDYGNTHWTVIDADTYVDWTDKQLTDWVINDLANSKNATWHFVMFHHPGFTSSVDHFEQQQMRLLAPVFEAGKVDIVFNGHVHNYQRSYPMYFTPDKKGILLVGGKDNKTIRGRVVNGEWKLDKVFDGVTNTKPKGVIYIVTGAGGQELYNPEQENDTDNWQKFTVKFISTVHSFTVVDVDGQHLKLQQLNAAGKQLDTINITK